MCEQTRLKIAWPDDFHVHLRRGAILQTVIRHTARCMRRALVMPNTEPNPVLTAEDALEYQEEILQAATDAGFSDFEPLMTIQIVGSTTPKMVQDAKKAGMVAAKLYAEGVTNARGGVRNLRDLTPVFRTMEETGLVLCLHGEARGHGIHVLNAEEAFLPELDWFVDAFPGLQIVLEHITTRAAVEKILSLPKTVAASITAHHLLLTFDDVVGSRMHPHLFCKPVAKMVEDRQALQEVAMSGGPKFFFGSDSAPHPSERKNGIEIWPGIFTAPTALEDLTDLFMRIGTPGTLESFVSRNGAAFYGLPFNEGQLELVRESWQPPQDVDGIPVFRGGEERVWRVRG